MSLQNVVNWYKFFKEGGEGTDGKEGFGGSSIFTNENQVNEIKDLGLQNRQLEIIEPNRYNFIWVFRLMSNVECDAKTTCLKKSVEWMLDFQNSQNFNERIVTGDET